MTFPLPPNEAALIAELIRVLDARVLTEEERMTKTKDKPFFDARLVPVGIQADELHGIQRLEAAEEAHAEDLRLWSDDEQDEAAA